MQQQASTYLTTQELVFLTGYTIPSKQSLALNSMRINHQVNANGKIIVLRSHHDEVLSGATGKTKGKKQPNFEALSNG